MRCNECGIDYPESMFSAGSETCYDCRLRFAESQRNMHSGNTKTANKIRTHYDNLKVARNAPIEVIRAAYKTLSQKYHPDTNKNDPDAERVMKTINASYEVLSDPEKREAHDMWIAEEESPTSSTYANTSYAPPSPHNSDSLPKVSPTLNAIANVVEFVFRHWLVCLFLLVGLFNVFDNKDKSPPPPGPKPYEAQPKEPEKPAYVRPITAPNGELWPTKAAYVPGYKRLNADGLSKVTVDNSQNNTDVFVKLVSLDGQKARPVRQFFIPGNSSFTVNKVRAGNYDIHCRFLDSGRLSRSESFTLEETPVDTGIKFSNMRMTLYKVKDGNMQSFDLAEDEF